MKISVITAVYNRVSTIGYTVESVQGQTYADVEHIIQDGGSTDGTLKCIDNIANAGTRLLSEFDNGIYDAINRGIMRSNGDIIGLMHSDDYFAGNDILENIATAFKNSTIDGVYGDLQYVLGSDPNRIVRYWRSGDYHPGLLKQGWMPPHPTLYLRREVFDRHGLYDTSFRIAADYDAMLRYLTKGQIKLAYIPKVFVKMRLGGESNRSLERVLLKSREDLRALRNNGVGGIGTLAAKNLSKLGQFIMKDEETK